MVLHFKDYLGEKSFFGIVPLCKNNMTIILGLFYLKQQVFANIHSKLNQSI